MSNDKDLASHIIARGERVILRRWLASDVDQFIYWLSHGEWRLIDAPWHGYRTVTTAEQEKRDREWFTQQLDGGEESVLNRPAVITTTAIPYSGQDIQISADLEKEGSIEVSVVDKDGKPISEAQTLSAAVTGGRLKLRQKIPADEIRLRFTLNHAKLYSFRLGLASDHDGSSDCGSGPTKSPQIALRA